MRRATCVRPSSRALRSRSFATAKPAVLADIDASKLMVRKSTALKPKQPNQSLVFGRTFTDHMLTIEWNADKGWGVPQIVPHGPLQIDPAAPVFHYGMGCFEGMKSYLDKQGKIRLFRPMKNMERLSRSSNFDKTQLLECIKQLLRVDKSWIPNEKGYSLYIRPTMVGSGSSLGVGPSNRALFYTILSPVGPYYPEGFKPIKLLADEIHVRAWPGGTGDAKVGGNYAPTIAPQVEAAKRGYTQILWLFGKEHYITEVGTMNMFVFLQNEKGEKELVTPPLDDGTILPGVTRDSILHLTRSWKEFKVSERPINMKELLTALKQNRVIEAFGAGTAAIVAPIKCIGYRDQDYAIPLDNDNPQAGAGKLAKRLATEIMAIQYGDVPSDWSVVVD